MKKILIRYILIMFVLLVYGADIIAQHNGNCYKRREKIEAYKIAFITEKLALTPNEAQKFWPLYNEFQEKAKALREACDFVPFHKIDIDKLTEKEMEDIMEKHIQREIKMAELKKEYHEKYKKVLPVKKIILYYDAEHEFKTVLLKHLKAPMHPDE